MAREKLGRGLDALLADVAPSAELSDDVQGMLEVEVSRIKPNPHQPRQTFNEQTLNYLTESIKQQGVIQPLLVKRQPDNTYQIISGERRWRAAQQAGIQKVPVVQREVTDQESVILALVENLQREDLNPFEEAVAIKHLREEHGLNQEQIGIAIGKSRTAISNSLRLLGLAEPVQSLLKSGQIGEAHGRTLLGLPTESQHAAAQKVIRQGLSVRQTEALVQRHKKTKVIRRPDPDVVRFEEELSDTLGATVTITGRGKRGGGILKIQYRNLEQLQNIVKRLKTK